MAPGQGLLFEILEHRSAFVWKLLRPACAEDTIPHVPVISERAVVLKLVVLLLAAERRRDVEAVVSSWEVVQKPLPDVTWEAALARERLGWETHLLGVGLGKVTLWLPLGAWEAVALSETLVPAEDRRVVGVQLRSEELRLTVALTMLVILELPEPQVCLSEQRARWKQQDRLRTVKTALWVSACSLPVLMQRVVWVEAVA